jgi:hypothetical protein
MKPVLNRTGDLGVVRVAEAGSRDVEVGTIFVLAVTGSLASLAGDSGPLSPVQLFDRPAAFFDLG